MTTSFCSSRFGRMVLLAATSVLLTAAGAHAGDQNGFFDDFSKIDPARWYISDGWSNGAWQNCGWSKQEITTVNGVLNVGFSHNPEAKRDYRCGEIQTKTALSYGTYEAA